MVETPHVAVPVPQVLEEKFHIQDDDVNRWGHVMSKTDTLESRLTIQKIPRSNDILYINVGLHNPQGIFGGIHYFGKAPVCFRSNFPSHLGILPPKEKVESENGPIEKEILFGQHHFGVPCLVLRGCSKTCLYSTLIQVW